MAKLPKMPSLFHALRDSHILWDDFDEFVTLDLWTSVLSNTGTVAVQDSDPSRITVTPSDGSVADNDESYCHQSFETWQFLDNRPLFFECFVQYAEQATDDANIIVGLKDAWAADSILDNAGGPAASYTGALFFKVDGGTRWQVETSVTTTQTTTDLTAANSLDGVIHTAGGTAFTKLGINFAPYSSTKAKVDFFIDEVHVASHDYTYTSATDVAIGFGAKNGGGTMDTLDVDWVFCTQKR